jgi:hypothetical protein
MQNSGEQIYFKFTYKRSGISKLIDVNIQEPKISEKGCSSMSASIYKSQTYSKILNI